MDSACSRHKTGNKTLFLSLEEEKGGMIAFDGEKRVKLEEVERLEDHMNTQLIKSTMWKDLDTIYSAYLNCVTKETR